jgi:class 3 adenylate cyclase
MDVAAWLQDLGLERYISAFRDNDIDAEVLLKLTAEDLISIGVTSVGHRRKLLDAIAGLGMTVPTAVVAAPASGGAAQVDAERRQLTVMFCDLVGSTALSTQYDPEDLRELIGDYHRAVAGTVARFDGFVAKYMGDGVLIYFGYPQAHEDDAERAVCAALAVIEAVCRLPARENLRVRLGFATGLAVVGDLIGEGAAQERGIVGETPNLAARLQALATPNTMVIAEGTRRQIGELFDLEDLGPQQLAGFAEPQHAWRVLGESGAVSRFEALRSGETPLVGGDEEIELLRRRSEQAKSGEGRVVLISGEPGIGKSRLTAVLSAHIESEPYSRLRYFCSPHHQDSALYPFIAQLERAAGFARDDTVDAKLGKLRALLAPATRDDDDSALILSPWIAHPFTLSLVLTFSAVLHLNRREHARALSLVEAVEALVTATALAPLRTWHSARRGLGRSGRRRRSNRPPSGGRNEIDPALGAPLWFGVPRRGFGVARRSGGGAGRTTGRAGNSSHHRRARVGCGAPASPGLCYSPKISSTRARLPFSTRSASRKPNKQSHSNCAPPAISPGCGASKVGAPKPATSSPRSIAGSPKDLTPPT